MANGPEVAKIALQVDGTGARREIKLTVEQLKALANGGKEAEAVLKKAIPSTIVPPQAERQIRGITDAMRKMQEVSRANAMASMIGKTDPFQQAQSIQKVADAAEKATPGLGRLHNQLGNVAVALSGIPGPVGRVANALGGFALGGGITVAVLAGIAAISFAWQKATEDMRNSEATMKRIAEGALGMSEAAMRAALAIHQLREANLASGREAFGGRATDVSVVGANRRERQLADERAIIGQLGTALADIERTKADEKMKDLAKATDEAREAAERFGQARKDSLNEWMSGQDPMARSLETIKRRAGEAKEWQDLINSGPGNPVGFAGLTEKDLGGFNAGLDAAIARLKKVLDELQKIKEQKRDALGHVAGFAIGKVADAAGPFGGMVSGVAGNLLAGNPWGAAAAGVTGLIDGIMGMREEAKRAREQFAQFTQGIQDFIDAEREALGIVSGLQARLNQVNRAYGDQRQAIQQAMDGLAAMNEMMGYDRERAQRWGQLNQQLQELNALEAERVAQLQKQQAEVERLMSLDNDVLRLRLLGHDEEAEALSRQIDHQREMNALIESGGSAREQSLLAEQHALADMIVKAEKIKERIASLTSTIEGLEGFRDSLTLDATRSPEERLVEARRQYSAIREAALAGDQDAAARLPEIARIVLDASRHFFGSGQGFQDEYMRVLADTNEAIAKFQDLRTIEEEMLEQLRRIAESTGRTADDFASFWGDLSEKDPVGKNGGGGSGGGGGGSSGDGKPPLGGASTNVAASTVNSSAAVYEGTQLGFSTLAQKLDLVVSRLEDQERTTRRLSDVITARMN